MQRGRPHEILKKVTDHREAKEGRTTFKETSGEQ
jgi:hypothetical protein